MIDSNLAEIERLRVALDEVQVQGEERVAAARLEASRLRAALSLMLESFTEPEDDNEILRQARAALGNDKPRSIDQESEIKTPLDPQARPYMDQDA